MGEVRESLPNGFIDTRDAIRKEGLEDKGYILSEREKGKFDISFDLSSLFQNDQLNNFKDKYSALLKVGLNAYSLNLDQIVKLSELIDRLLKDSDGGKLYIDKSLLNKITTTGRFDTYDIKSENKFLSIGGMEEIVEIVGDNDINEVIKFINEIIERRQLINKSLESNIKVSSIKSRDELREKLREKIV